MRNLLSKQEAAELVGLHPEYLMRIARAGRFPKPIRLGDRPGSAVRFVQDEIEQWLADKLAERDGAARAVA